MEEIKNIIKIVENNNGRVPSHIIDDMFELHNRIFPENKEYNKGCGACRQRTYNRLRDYKVD